VYYAEGFFPYEWMDDLSKLRRTSLPPYEAFYSALKGANITPSEYLYTLAIWLQLNMQTFKDYLVWYNNRDVEPFVQCVGIVAEY
jgi:hypothetical protein